MQMPQEGVRDTIIIQMCDLTEFLKGVLTSLEETMLPYLFLLLWHVMIIDQSVVEKQ